MTSTRWRGFCLSLLAALALVALAAPALATELPPRFTFFAGTQYPLDVHFLRGKEPGPTVMVQGGIQGDEVSGYLAAQILTRAQVHKGNLIIIPRANVPTVLAKKRQINVDLNRRFDQDYNAFFEDRLARAIRFLLRRSDAFIHLHEGSGFYHPTYVDGLRNPGRYGQSIIIDTPLYAGRINLAQVATSVLDQLNTSIAPDWQFKLFNTDTFSTRTAHPEQRKSLTYHALSEAGIPALAIEVSKNINQLGWKVRQQVRATCLTLAQYGVEVEVPEFSEQDVERAGVGGLSVVVNGQPLPPGGEIVLALGPGSRIEASAVRGPSLCDAVPAVVAPDRPDQNLVVAPRLALNRIPRLDVLADGARVGSVRVDWNEASGPKASGGVLFACWINGELRFVPEGGTLDALEGDQLLLEGIWGSSGPEAEVINLKGYVSQPLGNDGQDAGQEIILDIGTFIGRYLEKVGGGGVLCRVVRETPGMRRSEFSLRILSREVHALRLDGPGGEVVVPWLAGGSVTLPPGRYRLADGWSTGPRDKLLATTGHNLAPWASSFELHPGDTLPLTMRQATTFLPLGNMTLATSPQ